MDGIVVERRLSEADVTEERATVSYDMDEEIDKDII